MDGGWLGRTAATAGSLFGKGQGEGGHDSSWQHAVPDRLLPHRVSCTPCYASCILPGSHLAHFLVFLTGGSGSGTNGRGGSSGTPPSGPPAPTGPNAGGPLGSYPSDPPPPLGGGVLGGMPMGPFMTHAPVMSPQNSGAPPHPFMTFGGPPALGCWYPPSPSPRAAPLPSGLISPYPSGGPAYDGGCGSYFEVFTAVLLRGCEFARREPAVCLPLTQMGCVHLQVYKTDTLPSVSNVLCGCSGIHLH